MQHLSSEFSMECLLAFTEFTQFRMLLESDTAFMSRVKAENIGKHDDEKQPENVPKMKLDTPSVSKSSNEPSVSDNEEDQTTSVVQMKTSERKKRVHPYTLVVLPSDIPQSIIVFGETADATKPFVQIAAE